MIHQTSQEFLSYLIHYAAASPSPLKPAYPQVNTSYRAVKRYAQLMALGRRHAVLPHIECV